MLPVRRSLTAVLVVVLGFPLAAAAAETPARPRPEHAYLTAVRAAAQTLVRQVERLQEDIIADLGGQKERTLYRQADEVLGEAERFQRSVKSGASHPALYKAFNALDLKQEALLKAVRAAGKNAPGLTRSAARITAAAGELHYALSTGDTAEGQTRQVMRRQAEALGAAVRDLGQTAHYALAASADRDTLEVNLRKLTEATERFQKSLTKKAGRRQLQDEFTRLGHAWKLVSAGLNRLPVRENIYLLRGAARVEHFTTRLYQLLGLKGEGPQLSIRT
jgi:hypothetical protein